MKLDLLHTDEHRAGSQRGSKTVTAARAMMALCILLALVPWARCSAEESDRKVVFQLDFHDPRLPAWLKPCAVITNRPDGRPALRADTRNADGSYITFLALPPGIIRGGQDYEVTVDYEVVELADAGCFFYMGAMSESLGRGPDERVQWNGQPGTKGRARLPVSQPQDGDATLALGVYRKGALLVDALTIRAGSGLRLMPIAAGQPPRRAAAPKDLPTGTADFAIDPPAPKTNLVVSVAEFGAVADGPEGPAKAADGNRAAFMRAIARCRDAGAARLVVPAGVYRITSREPLLFDDLADLVVDGQGSELIFSKTALPAWPAGIEINRCRRCVFRDLQIDWDWDVAPLASVGRIAATAPDGSYFDMEFPDETAIDAKTPWRSMWPLYGEERAYGRDGEWRIGPKRVEQLKPNVLRAWPTWTAPVKVGELYLVRHFEYDKNCFYIGDSAHLTLTNITIYSFPGIGYVVHGDQHHWELRNCRITQKPGSHRPITCTADGYNVETSQGYMRLENCEFGWNGDDSVNVKDVSCMGVIPVDRQTLIAERVNQWRYPFHVGDEVEFRRGDLAPAGYVSKVTAVQQDQPTLQCRLTFADPLPDQLAPDTVLFNRRYGLSHVIIRNCWFHQNRNRGLLINARDALIESNRFDRIQSVGVLVETSCAPKWSEGHGASNLVFRGNTFDRVNPKGTWSGAAICVRTDIPAGLTAYPIAQSLLFEGNTFEDVPGLPLTLASCRNVTIRDNVFRNPTLLPNPLALRGRIRAALASAIRVVANTWEQSAYVQQPGVEIDPATTDAVTLDGNIEAGN